MLLSLLLLLQDPLAVRADTLRPRHEALHHDITVSIADTGSHILVQARSTWLLRSDQPLELELDSTYRVIWVQSDSQEGGDVKRSAYALEPGGGVYLPHGKHAGDTLHTVIRYHGYPRDGLVIRTDSAGHRTVFADNWPDRVHLWLPLQDAPSDKATVDFHVEVPASMRVVANGTLVKIDTLAYGRRVWSFHLAERIPPYGMVIGAGDLAFTPLPDAACEVKCVPITVVTYPQDSAWAVNGPFHRAGDMVDFFSRYVGPFPYERLDHVESTTIFGGMENPTAIFYDDGAYASHRLSESTVAHETAHQWFGDAVTEDDWHHLWLSEGFATYFSALWVRHADGDSAFRATMARAARAVFGSKATARPILDSAATDLMGLLNSNNYPKGAWVLHSLRGLMGDSAFAAGIRDYYRSFRDSTALSSDFAAVMSRAAGQDLSWYFRQALTQPGYPRLDVHWSWARGRLTLRVRQTQPEAWGLYRLPGLIVSVDGRELPVTVEGRETTVTLDVPKRPGTVTLDPDGWWLMQATVAPTAGT